MSVSASTEPRTADLSILAEVAVLIINYNTGEVLQQGLRSLQPGVAAGLQIVVVDNGSDDGSLEMLRRDHPEIRLVESGGNRGFGTAVNIAARETNRAFLLILNPDCFIHLDAVARLATRLADSAGLGFVGPRIDLESGRPDHACLRADPDPLGALLYFSRLPKLFPGRRSLNRYSLAHADYDAEQELIAGTAACLMVRSIDFHAVGRFDESFFMYGEDLDLCRRLRRAGRTGWYVPGSRALHLKGEASRKQSRQMLVEFHRAMWIYYRKYEKPSRPAPVNWGVAGGIAILAGVRIGLNAVRRDKWVSAR